MKQDATKRVASTHMFLKKERNEITIIESTINDKFVDNLSNNLIGTEQRTNSRTDMKNTLINTLSMIYFIGTEQRPNCRTDMKNTFNIQLTPNFNILSISHSTAKTFFFFF